MTTLSTPIAEMARGVHDLVTLERRRLHELDELAYREGLSPGQDVSFGGIRAAVARAEAAEKLLLELARSESAFRAWFGSGRLADAKPERNLPNHGPI